MSTRNAVRNQLKTVALLCLICLVGAVLRFYRLGEKGLWYDEITSLISATGHAAAQTSIDVELSSSRLTQLGQESHLADVLRVSQYEPHPPLYFLLLNLWIRFFGTSEAAVRSLSAIVSIFSIPMIFVITSKLLNEKVGLMSAAIFSISSYQIYYAQEVRVYALVVFLGLLSTFLFLKILETHERKRGFWIGYMLTAVSIFYAHYYGIFVILFHNLYLLFRWKTYGPLLKRWIMAQLVVGLLFSPMLVLVHYRTQTILSHEDTLWLKKPTPRLWPLTVFPTTVGKFSLGEEFNLWEDTGRKLPRLGLLALAIVVFGGLFLSGLWAGRRNPEILEVLLLWMFTSFFAAVLLDLLLGRRATLISRYFIAISPPYYILLAWGIARLETRSRRIAATALLTLLCGICLVRYYHDPKQQWREAAHYIDTKQDGNDLIIVCRHGRLYSTIACIDHYLKKPILQIGLTHTDVPEKIGHVTNGIDKVWVIVPVTVTKEIALDGVAIRRWLHRYYRLVDSVEFKHVAVFKYER